MEGVSHAGEARSEISSYAWAPSPGEMHGEERSRVSELGHTLTWLFPSQLTGTPGKGGLSVQASPVELCHRAPVSGCCPEQALSASQPPATHRPRNI